MLHDLDTACLVMAEQHHSSSKMPDGMDNGERVTTDNHVHADDHHLQHLGRDEEEGSSIISLVDWLNNNFEKLYVIN